MILSLNETGSGSSVFPRLPWIWGRTDFLPDERKRRSRRTPLRASAGNRLFAFSPCALFRAGRAFPPPGHSAPRWRLAGWSGVPRPWHTFFTEYQSPCNPYLLPLSSAHRPPPQRSASQPPFPFHGLLQLRLPGEAPPEPSLQPPHSDRTSYLQL